MDFPGGGYGALIILAALVFSHDTLKNPDDSWTSYPIAHAMGAIDGYDYTNSLEAFEYNYSLGHRVFEVDFSVTSDGKMACMHDWNFGYQDGVDSEHIPSEETFKSIPIAGKYTALTLKDLLLLMEEYEDIYIVTDTKSGGAKIAEHMEIIMETVRETGTEDVLDRLIIQMYKPNMSEKIKNVYDFPIMILTLYSSVWDETSEGFLPICRFCKNNNIRYITMWWYLATPEILDIAKSYGITVFVHTVNDLDMAEELIQSGVGGVYTDELVPSLFWD